MALSNPAKVRIAAAITAIGLAGSIVACSDDNGYDNCPDWQCGDGLYLIPYVVHPAFGVYGQPGYVAPVIIQPGQPNYHPSYQGKPPNFTPPPSAKVNPPGAKPPANYKPPTGSTLTVQKAPQRSGNTQPGSNKSSSGGGGSKVTVQKAPAKAPTAPKGGKR